MMLPTDAAMTTRRSSLSGTFAALAMGLLVSGDVRRGTRRRTSARDGACDPCPPGAAWKMPEAPWRVIVRKRLAVRGWQRPRLGAKAKAPGYRGRDAARAS